MNPYSLVVRIYRDSHGRYWMDEHDIRRLCPGSQMAVDSSILLEIEVKKIIKEENSS